MEVLFDVKLTKGQNKVRDTLYSDDCRYCVVKFSRQSGKSVLAEILCIEYLLKNKTYSVYVGPTYLLCEKVFDEIKDLLAPTGLLKNANAQKMIIETVFGSKLKFFSMANSNMVRGFTVKSGIMVLDEAAYYQTMNADGQDPWLILFPLVKANLKRNKILFISTPRLKSGLFYESYMRALNGLKNWKCISATIYDDELITEEEILEIKDSMNELSFRLEFLCEFSDSGITFFLGFENCFNRTNFYYNDNLTLYIGLDPAANGQDDMVLTKINSSGLAISIEITGSLDEKYKQCADIINNTRNLKGIYIEVNGVGSPICNEIKKLLKSNLLKSLVTEFNTTNTNKIEILSDLAVGIAKKELEFDINNTKLYTLFSLFGTAYSKTGKLQLLGLGGSHDDYIMSLGLAYAALLNYSKLGSYSFSF